MSTHDTSSDDWIIDISETQSTAPQSAEAVSTVAQGTEAVSTVAQGTGRGGRKRRASGAGHGAMGNDGAGAMSNGLSLTYPTAPSSRVTTRTATQMALEATKHLDTRAVMEQLATGRFADVAAANGVSTRDLWIWIKTDRDRLDEYQTTREVRAIGLVDDAHRRTAALADRLPDSPHAVMAHVKHVQWDASRTSRQYADRQTVETHNAVDITVTLQDTEVAARLSSLMGAIDAGQVVDGEIVE